MQHDLHKAEEAPVMENKFVKCYSNHFRKQTKELVWITQKQTGQDSESEFLAKKIDQKATVVLGSLWNLNKGSRRGACVCGKSTVHSVVEEGFMAWESPQLLL